MGKGSVLDKTTALVENPKRMVALIIIIVIIVILYFVLKGQLKPLFQSLANKLESNKALNEEMAATGQSPSYTDGAYEAYAKRLYNAMKGWGSDEDAIYSVFNDMKNTADVLKLINVFGTRDSETLSEWLRDDLSSGEIKKVNSILTSKNINYQF